jgi:hypothetical protein
MLKWNREILSKKWHSMVFEWNEWMGSLNGKINVDWDDWVGSQQ